MFANMDNAAFAGMTGGVVCMPWVLDSAKFRSAEGVAKMAAWGFYPHIVLGVNERRAKRIVPCEPDDPVHTFVLPYWRVLANIDVENVTVYNLPSQNVIAVTSSNPDFNSIVYMAGEDTYLLLTAKLGSHPAKATLSLDAEVLGMAGEYQVGRIDATTGQVHPHGTSAGTINTAELGQWGFEGYLFTKR